MKVAFPTIDQDKDGRVTSEEVVAVLQKFADSRVGLIRLACFLRVNGAPAQNVTVKLIPESFLDGDVEAAEGLSDSQGMAVPSIPEESLPSPNARGIRLGIYRVEMSQLTNGREQLPAKYNRTSELGLFMSPDTSDMQTFTLTR